jgi:uncharacterized protein (DUF2141 family)
MFARSTALAGLIALGSTLLPSDRASADPASVAPTTRLTLHVSGLPSSEGTVRAALFAGPKGFPTETRFAAVLREVPIADGRATVVFEAAPCATGCAVSLFHDRNGNQGLDRSWLGIPTEAIGISRDALGPFGPRGYEDAEVRTSEPALSLAIEVRSY